MHRVAIRPICKREISTNSGESATNYPLYDNSNDSYPTPISHLYDNSNDSYPTYIYPLYDNSNDSYPTHYALRGARLPHSGARTRPASAGGHCGGGGAASPGGGGSEASRGRGSGAGVCGWLGLCILYSPHTNAHNTTPLRARTLQVREEGLESIYSSPYSY